jgi:hypothetical protein
LAALPLYLEYLYSIFDSHLEIHVSKFTKIYRNLKTFLESQARLLPALKNKAFDSLMFLALFAAVFLQAYCIFKYGNFIHFDEFVGRGLYPGLAFFNGFDLYEPKTGPHVTLYGWATGLFYSISGLANSPRGAIWIAYLSNIISFCLCSFFLFKVFVESQNDSKKINCASIICITSSLISLFLTDPTTESICRIHADLPAYVFLLLGTISLYYYLRRNHTGALFISALCFTLAAWAKLPTLPCLAMPACFLFWEKKYRGIFLYFLLAFFALLLTTVASGLAYGFEDMKFILYDHISTAGWSVRDHLFDGKDAKIVRMNYLEAVPLLFRFFVMYLHFYWYVFVGAFLCFLISFSPNLPFGCYFIFRSLSILYGLVLPPCLSAIAHFGGVANSLFFANCLGLSCLFLFLFFVVRKIVSEKKTIIAFLLICLVLVLPNVRQSKSLPSTDSDSPQQQAYDYLSKGNKDVYFGWYPIAHLLANGQNVSCIETTIWVGMTRPDEIDFSIDHFPEGSKYLATCYVGYGRTVLQQYLGTLDEVPSPLELSGWRLFEIRDRKTR